MGALATCFLDMELLNDQVSKIMMPPTATFNHKLCRKQFSYFRYAEVRVEVAAPKIAALLGCSVDSVVQRYCAYKALDDVLTSADFVKLAYLMFRGGDTELIPFYLLDQDFDGCVCKTDVAELLTRKKGGNAARLLYYKCGRLFLIPAEMYLVLLGGEIE